MYNRYTFFVAQKSNSHSWDIFQTYIICFIPVRLFTTEDHRTHKNYHRTTPESHHRTHFLYHYTGIFDIMLRN